MSWQLPDEAFEFLKHRLTPGCTVVELGSGEGTARLVEMGCKVYSVEHDAKWVGKVRGTTYIHAPIVKGWYDASVLEKQLPPSCDCLIIDGPPGSIGRRGMLDHLHLFKPGPTLLDDVHRSEEQALLLELLGAWGVKSYSVHNLYWRSFATFGWGKL